MQAFKGVAFYASTCSDLNALGVSWYYDWQETTRCTGVEFVPQVWGDWTAGGGSWGGMSPAQLVANGATTVLAFNEPDNPGQSNLSVDQAIALWPQFDLPGVKIGSPGTGGACCPNTGEDWLNQFMAAIAQNKLREPDIIAIHWYGWGSGECDDTSQLEAKIQWAEQWNLPIWMTEWGCYQAESTQVVDKFYADAIAMFKNHPLLERYAWYLSRSSSDPNFANATLLDQNGNPTALGSEYVAAPSYR
jgi:Glycosyl hydrolase catalytic core